jgi:hypothetical protein
LFCRNRRIYEADTDIITTKQAADRWSVTVRRDQSLCEKEMIDGAEKLAGMRVLLLNARKPIDDCTKSAKALKSSHSLINKMKGD